jgi:LmbE family N-acetylglucosaminyl deacetylase
MEKVEPVYCLVVSPHPDDAEFGVAGSVAKWVREGKDVVYVCCTSGDKGTSDPHIMPPVLAKIREAEQQEAAKVLGVRDVVFLRIPDQGVEDTPEFRKELVRLIRLYRPDVVASSDPYRKYIWHRDHRITGQVVLDAVFPYARDVHAYPDLYEQGYLPHKVKEILFWGAPDINYRIDISETIEQKITALMCHKSQFNVAEMEKRIRERYRAAAESGHEYVESFHRVDVGR